MLKGISPLLSPELLKILMEMGHGDTIVLGDGNFPAASCAKRLVRCDGQSIAPLLKAILQLFPLDKPESNPAIVMQVEGNSAPQPEIWETYRNVISAYEPSIQNLTEMARFSFYEKARSAYAIVATSESALFANLILKKGVVI